MKAQATVIIRERGQLTIPDSIRTTLNWTTPTSVVTISTEKPDEIVIRPHGIRQQIDWDELWNKIELSRSFRGKRGNLSAFISEDRRRH